jgi:hypothetical protein
MEEQANLKFQVRDFWDKKSCGEAYATGGSEEEYYETQSKARYELEPYISGFAKFHEACICPLSTIYANYLESSGTKVYSLSEARKMFKKFSKVSIQIRLTFGDLLEGAVGQRHRGLLLSMARRWVPRGYSE